MASKNYDPVKRALDIVLSSAVLVVTMPLQLLVAGLVAINLGRPVLFRQQRPGLDGEIFELVKFRSMKEVDHEKNLITNEQRITRFGKFIRATSLDELPSLVNIARGEMSLVGPRPLRVDYLPRYSAEQGRRHDVRPGLTGLAQVSGRNALGWEDRFKLDVKYVDERSLKLDIEILFRTIGKVLKRDGISSEGHVGSMPFLGSEDQKNSEKE